MTEVLGRAEDFCQGRGNLFVTPEQPPPPEEWAKFTQG